MSMAAWVEELVCAPTQLPQAAKILATNMALDPLHAGIALQKSNPMNERLAGTPDSEHLAGPSHGQFACDLCAWTLHMRLACVFMHLVI